MIHQLQAAQLFEIHKSIVCLVLIHKNMLDSTKTITYNLLAICTSKKKQMCIHPSKSGSEEVSDAFTARNIENLVDIPEENYLNLYHIRSSIYYKMQQN